MADTQRHAEAAPALAKLILDLGPLIAFFVVNALYGIFAATAVFMVTIAIALIASRVLYGELAAMPIVTALFVLVFGGLTLYLQDETFIKMKPTVVYLLFAALLFAGLALKRHFLKTLMGEVFSLSEDGWLELTKRWIYFFIALALLNEIAWRNFSTDTWVSLKVFGFLPLTVLFAALQVGLLRKYGTEDE